MSVETANHHNDSNCNENPCRSIKLVIEPRSRDLGGFSVTRILPFLKCKKVGPWVFFDHMGPVDFAPGKGIDVRPHPHINLATVTYLFEGHMLHQDSVGSHLHVNPGDVNLMVAGKGIVHSERTPTELIKTGQHFDGLQLWLALPKGSEEIEPEFHHYDKTDIPHSTINGVSVRVLIGEAYGLTSPVKTFAKTAYIEVKLKAGQQITAPSEQELAAYIVKGQVSVQNHLIHAHHMAVFDTNHETVIEATEDTLLVFIGGESLSKRHIYWNFVSSDTKRIEQAKQDWQNNKFKLIDTDHDESIPLPE